MLVEALIFSFAFNLVGFLLGYSFRSDKFTDISYALTFSAIALFGFLSSDKTPVQWIVTAVILLWAYRIGSYLFKRINFMGRDKRFDEMRDDFVKFGGFWLLQAVTVWLVMFPPSLLYGVESSTNVTALTLVGAGISVFGILFEGIADLQKFKFISDPNNKGKWISSGLWKYSRHPNYFGEIMMWIGIYLICIEWLTKTEVYLAAIGPASIIFMLLFVSGVPLLEKSADRKWGNKKEYRNYRDRTSILIPMPPKKG